MPRQRACVTHILGDRVNPRAGLGDLEKRKINQDFAFVLSMAQSLYQLCRPGSGMLKFTSFNYEI